MKALNNARQQDGKGSTWNNVTMKFSMEFLGKYWASRMTHFLAQDGVLIHHNIWDLYTIIDSTYYVVVFGYSINLLSKSEDKFIGIVPIGHPPPQFPDFQGLGLAGKSSWNQNEYGSSTVVAQDSFGKTLGTFHCLQTVEYVPMSTSDPYAMCSCCKYN